MGMGFQTILVAFLADLLAANRQLLEEIRYGLNRGSHPVSMPDVARPSKLSTEVPK